MSLSRALTIAVLACAMQAALAADPGESWFTHDAGSGNPPDGMSWLAPESLCRVPPARLAQAVQALEARSFEPLTARSLPLYAATACKGKYGERDRKSTRLNSSHH